MNVIYSQYPHEYINYVLQEIEDKIIKDRYKKIYILVSEQRKLYFENLLFAKTKEQSFLNVEVMSHKRFLYHILNEIGSVFNNIVLAEATTIETLLYLFFTNKRINSEDLLSKIDEDKVQENFNNIKKNADIDSLINLKSEMDILSRNGIDENKLNSIIDNLAENAIDRDLIDRLNYLLIISKKYKQILRDNQLYDNSDSLDTLLNILDKLSFFQGDKKNCELKCIKNFYEDLSRSDFYFLGNAESRFVNRREIQLFELIDKLANNTAITAEINDVELDELLLNHTWSTQSFFAPAAKMIVSLIENNKVSFYNANSVSNNLSKDKLDIEQRVFRILANDWYDYNSINGINLEDRDTSKIGLKNAFSIIRGKKFENTLENILGLIKYLNIIYSVDFKDIAICNASHKDEDIQNLKTYLKEYDIPYYYDEEISINTSPLILHIIGILKLVEFCPYPLMLDDISKLIKIIPNPRLKELTNCFENFALKYSSNFSYLIKKYPKLKEENLASLLDCYPDIDSYDGFITNISSYVYYKSDENTIKQKMRKRDNDFLSFVYIMEEFVNPILNLKDNLSKVEDAIRYKDYIYDYLKQIKIEKMLEKIILLPEYDRDLRDSLIFAWNFLIQFLAEFSKIINKTDCNIYDFRKLIDLTSSKFKTNRLPAGLNQVYVSSPEKVSQASFKYIFVIQAYQDSFPYSIFNKNRYFKLDDYKYLPSDDFIYPVKENRISERLIAYNLFQAASHHICFAYGGNIDNESNIFAYLQKHFIKNFVDSSQVVINLVDNKDFNNLSNLAWSKQINLFLLNNDTEQLTYLLNNNSLDDNIRCLSYILQNMPKFLTESELLYNPKTIEKNLTIDGAYPNATNADLNLVLFPDNKKYSVSQLELYSQCPLKYFYTYVLSLKDRNFANIDARLQGTITHAFWETVFKDFYINKAFNTQGTTILSTSEDHRQVSDNCSLVSLSSDETQEKDILEYRDLLKSNLLDYLWKIESEEEINKRLAQIVANLGQESLFEADFNGAAYAIKRIIKQTINAFIIELQSVQDTAFYQPEYFEWTFVCNSDTNIFGNKLPLDIQNDKINLIASENELELQGKIDRIDKLLIKSDTEQFRVVDYKIGKKDIDFERIINGVDLQLLVYVYVFEQYWKNKMKQIKVKDAVYFLLDASSYSLGKSEREEIRKLINSSANGNDRELNNYLREIQSRTFKQNSLLARVSNELDKLTRVLQIEENGITEEKIIDKIISALKDIVMNKCADNISSIHEGIFYARPYYDEKISPCTYCAYRVACRSCDEFHKTEMRDKQDE